MVAPAVAFVPIEILWLNAPLALPTVMLPAEAAPLFPVCSTIAFDPLPPCSVRVELVLLADPTVMTWFVDVPPSPMWMV